MLFLYILANNIFFAIWNAGRNSMDSTQVEFEAKSARDGAWLVIKFCLISSLNSFSLKLWTETIACIIWCFCVLDLSHFIWKRILYNMFDLFVTSCWQKVLEDRYNIKIKSVSLYFFIPSFCQTLDLGLLICAIWRWRAVWWLFSGMHKGYSNFSMISRRRHGCLAPTQGCTVVQTLDMRTWLCMHIPWDLWIFE